MADDLDLDRRRRLHVTNVGGAGMSAVATLLAEMGHVVSGHDPAASTPFLPMLRAAGVDVTAGPESAPLAPEVDAVVVSTATPADDPDVVAAIARGLAVVHRSQALAAICRRRRTVAVAGTHGKTTTSAMLATILVDAGLDPGWVVGSPVPQLGRSAAWGGDGPLVVEADESDGTFLALGADLGVVTNVEADHLEHWGGERGLHEAFRRFASSLPAGAVVGLDDPGAAALVASCATVVGYGAAAEADYRVADVTTDGTGVRFALHHDGEGLAVAVPNAPGAHNAANATAALAAAHRLGVPLDVGARALASFAGVARRFERRGEAGGVVVVDDYAHLPTEVAAALSAAAGGGWSRVIAVFQPHRYSRTAALWRQFADAFRAADRVAITDVYPAGEAPREGVSGKLVVDALLESHPRASVAWLPALDDVVVWLRSTLREGDLCITVGAGDLTHLAPRILEMLEGRDRDHPRPLVEVEGPGSR